MLGYLTGLIGMWLVSDAIWSINYYLHNKDETWLRNHSVRLVRLLCGIALMVIGVYTR